MSINDYVTDEELRILLDKQHSDAEAEIPASKVHTDETQEPSSFLPRSKRTRKNRS